MSGPVSATTPATNTAPAAPAASTPVHYIAGDLDLSVKRLDGLHGQVGLYEVRYDGQTLKMDDYQLNHFLAAVHARQPGTSDSNPLGSIGQCTVHGSDGPSWRDRFVPSNPNVPEPPRLSQGPGTGATESTPWDQRFQHMPTRYEEFQANMAGNQNINLLNAVQVVVLAATGHDHRPYLEQTAPLSNALLAVGGAKAAAAAQPVLTAPRPQVTTPQAQYNAAPGGPAGAGVPVRQIPGARVDRATPQEQATFSASVNLRTELAETQFRNGQIQYDVGGARSAPATIDPNVTRTLHTHPVSMQARPSAADLRIYANACFSDNTVHEILGDRWPNARQTLNSMGMDTPPLDAVKYSVTSGQVRAAGGTP